jgi:tripartite-type tricarboxylate transporter receptor subunit TctC
MSYVKTFTRALAIAMASAVTFGAVAVAQAEYPDNTMRIIVPWRAGGGTDSVARALATPMEKISGQAVLVENITGGSGTAGMLAVKNAKADGYTMVLNGSADITAPIVFKNVPYSMADYSCVGGVYATPTWIIANKEQGFNDFGDFVKAAKAEPGKLALGVTALGSPDHVTADLLIKKYGIDVRVIPFNGGAPLKKALIGNQVNAGVLIAPVMLEEVKAGVANVLVAGGSLKSIKHEPLQGMATLKDHGIDQEISMIRGVYMPKDTPAAVVEKAIAIVGEAARSDAFKEFGAKFGFDPVWIPGGEFCDFMKSEDAAYRSIQ